MTQPDDSRNPLTPQQEELILKLAAQGLSGRKIAERPEIQVSYSSVNRFLKDRRRERAEATKDIVRGHLAATLPTDLEMLDKLTRRLEVMRQDAEQMGLAGFNMEMQVIDRQVKTIGLKLKYSGADEDDSAQRLIEALSGDD
ncbi:hypothetical protein GCM10022631_11880 [Deinococcus rubellus]